MVKLPLGIHCHNDSELAVANSDPSEGGVKQFYQSVILNLTTPIKDENLKRFVSIEPEIPNFAVYWNPYDRQMYVDGSYTPGESYTLRLSPELVDVWGDALDSEYTLNFTNADLPAGVVLTNYSEAPFLTAQDNSLSVQVTNFSTLNLTRGSLPLQDFISMVSSENGYEMRRRYQPADARSWQQPVDVPFNQTQAVDVYVSPDQVPLPPGLYFMRFNDLPQDVFVDPFLLVVSDVQVTFKLGATDVLVWTVDLDGITPRAGLPVTVYDGAGTALVSGETDERGLFYSSISPIRDPYTTYYAVISQPGEADFGMALSSWSQGINPWDFNLSGNVQPPQLKGYFYTDRPLYRPGQTVYFRGVVRQAFNGRYDMPEFSSLPMVLYHDYGQEVARFDLPLSEFGTLNGEYSLPEDARLGNYRLAADLPDLNIPLEVYFRVAEYRKPEIEMQVQFDADQAQAGQTLTAVVDANFYFGAPASDLSVEWTLTANDLPFDLPGYQVGVDDLRWMSAFPSFFGFGRFIEQGQGRTDAQGRLVLELDTGEVESRQRYTLEVTLQDESGQRISGRDTIDVNPAEFYIGVRPDAWVGRSGEASGFDVLVTDWETQPVGARALQADFRKVVWERQDPAPSDIFGEPRFVPEYTPVDSTQLTTDADGQARLTFTPPEPGTYQLDVYGDGARTSLILWIGGPGQAVWPNLPNDRLRLTADQKSYLPGETASLFVPNPFGQNALGLLTVERGTVLRYEIVELPPNGDSLEVPLTGQDAPNVYVSVTLLGRAPDGRPDFRQGYLDIPVEPVEQTFDVQLESQPSQAGPGDQVTLSLQVTDEAGLPVQGEFSLSVVDEALLALADPNAPDITQAFYG
ncbi:MAG: MG2 domain-containing protein, partial [Anaerolineales bacterium]